MKKYLLFFSLLLITAFWGSFLAVDIHSGFSNNYYSKSIRYVSLLICVFFVFFAGKDAYSPRDHKRMRWAFFFTACADFSISMLCHYRFFSCDACGTLSKYQFGIGMGFFLIVQIIYIRRHKQNFKLNTREVITALTIIVIMAIKVAEFGNTLLREGSRPSTILFAVAAIYAIVLCISVWMAIGTIWRGHFPRTTAWLIALGMGLFFLCDNSLARYIIYPQTAPVAERESLIKVENPINVAQVEIIGDQVAVYTNKAHAKTIVIPFTMKSIFGILVWFFYLPAQVLLMLSAFKPSFLGEVFPIFKEE